MAVSSSLLADVKNYLDVTWTDTVLDAKLTGQIERGIAYLTKKTGATDFETEGQAKTLLFNWLLYDRAGSLDEFRKNYMPDIVGMQIDKEVTDYAANTTS